MNFNSGGNENPPGMNKNSSFQSISKTNGFNTKLQLSQAAPFNSIEFSSTCSVCAEIDPKFWSVSPCGHKICWICSLRMRALYNCRACPICKSQSDCVFVCNESETSVVDEFFKSFFKKTKQSESKVQFPFNNLLSIGFESENIKLICEKLLLLHCPFNHNPQKNSTLNSILPCTKHFKTRNELRKHIQVAHDLYLCEICFEHKKVFTIELALYNRSTLQKHQRDTNHPRCQVCKSIFYSEDELHEHCRDEHELCHICKRTGVPNRHFQNYTHLEEHFQRDHFLCPEPVCRDLKFVVFESELEYKAHQAEVHLAHLKMQRSQHRQLQRLNISFDNNSNSNSNTNSINNSNTNTNSIVTNSLKLTNDQRNQIGVNLVYGEVTDDLANRLQSLNLYQTRNDEFIESLRCSHHLNQIQIQNLLNSARAFQRNESSATEFLIKIETIVTDSRIILDILKTLNDLQLDEVRKQRLNVAIHEYQKKCSAFPELPSSLKGNNYNNNNFKNGKDLKNLSKNKVNTAEDPFEFARLRTSESSSSSSATATADNKNKLSNPTNRSVKVLHILKPSATTSSNSSNNYNNSSTDPSQNPSLLLSQLAGGPNLGSFKNNKSQGSRKLMMTPLSTSSFSSAASSSTGFAAVNKVKIKHFNNTTTAKNITTTTANSLDNEAFPSLIKDKVKGNISAVSTNFSTPVTPPNNAFFAPSDRDQLESFTIGNEIGKDFIEGAGNVDEKASTDILKKKKTKKVVFRYGQKWDI